jgi:hypothetical protein
MERMRLNYTFDYSVTFTNAVMPEHFIPPMLLQPFCRKRYLAWFCQHA